MPSTEARPHEFKFIRLVGLLKSYFTDPGYWAKGAIAPQRRDEAERKGENLRQIADATGSPQAAVDAERLFAEAKAANDHWEWFLETYNAGFALIEEICPANLRHLPANTFKALTSADADAVASAMHIVLSEVLGMQKQSASVAQGVKADEESGADVLSDPITVQQLSALLVTVTPKTIHNMKAKRPAPAYKIPNVWSYSELLPWARECWPLHHHRLPDGYRDAVALISGETV